jgi:hypothetical protein
MDAYIKEQKMAFYEHLAWLIMLLSRSHPVLVPSSISDEDRQLKILTSSHGVYLPATESGSIIFFIIRIFALQLVFHGRCVSGIEYHYLLLLLRLHIMASEQRCIAADEDLILLDLGENAVARKLVREILPLQVAREG